MRANWLLLFTFPLTVAIADELDSRFSGPYDASAKPADSNVSRDSRAGGPRVYKLFEPDIPALPIDARPRTSTGFHIEPSGKLTHDDKALPRTGNLSIDSDELQSRSNCERVQQRLRDQRQNIPFDCN
ncbi:hypothetical protein [Pseudomonas nicosulfuronedens]